MSFVSFAAGFFTVLRQREDGSYRWVVFFLRNLCAILAMAHSQLLKYFEEMMHYLDEKQKIKLGIIDNSKARTKN